MTKEQLARWRELGFEFPGFYDTIAVNTIPEVSIKFVSAKKDDKQYTIKVAFTAKNCKTGLATISLNVVLKPLSFTEFGIVKNIKFTGETSTFEFKFDVNPFEPNKFEDVDFVATLTIDGLQAVTNSFQIEKRKGKDEKKDEQNNCEEKFKKISKIILKHEGGYNDDPNDKGGKTNKGIAWQTWLAYSKKDLNLEPTLKNLKNLSDEQAEIIYRKRYWEPKGLCLVNNSKIALMYYDWTITSGGATRTFKKFLENEYNLEIDSEKLNTNIANAINEIIDQKKLLEDLTKLRSEYYENLAYKTNKDGSFKKDENGNLIKTSDFTNLKGWLNRVESCKNIKI